MQKSQKTKKSQKPAANVKNAGATESTTTIKKTPITADQAKANAAEHIVKLNAVFTSAYPGRPVFGQRRFTPLNPAAHTPQSESARDTAFIKALRTVYGDKPFTQQNTGADTGNLQRALSLKLIAATGKNDDNGHPYYAVNR